MTTLEELKSQLNRIEEYTLLAAKNVLSVDDACLLTGLSKCLIYRLTRENKIPYSKPNGKNIYFDRHELETWLRRNRVATDTEIAERAAEYNHAKAI